MPKTNARDNRMPNKQSVTPVVARGTQQKQEAPRQQTGSMRNPAAGPLPQHGHAVPQLNGTMRQSSPGVAQLNGAMRQSSHGVPQPNGTMHRHSPGTPQPNGMVRQQSQGAPQPNAAMPVHNSFPPQATGMQHQLGHVSHQPSAMSPQHEVPAYPPSGRPFKTYAMTQQHPAMQPYPGYQSSMAPRPSSQSGQPLSHTASLSKQPGYGAESYGSIQPPFSYESFHGNDMPPQSIRMTAPSSSAPRSFGQHSPYPYGGMPLQSSQMPYQSSSMPRRYGQMNDHASGMVSSRGFLPVSIPPAKRYPADPYMEQLSLPEALRKGTLFRWMHDPYVNPYQ